MTPMNTSNRTPENNPTPPPLPEPKRDPRFDSLPMESTNPMATVEALLKFPGRILFELKSGRMSVAAGLVLIATICLCVYGVVAGSLSGGAQLWVAPAKIMVGSAVCVLICLPSLYIFLCLSGADVSLRAVSGELLAMVSLMALLLIGFAPVAWVFSQSTDSIGLMAFLHLMFWAVALSFGAAMLRGSGAGTSRAGTRVWMMIYVVVCLQMMTALRPIVGTADTFLPTSKKFFLTHMAEVTGLQKAEPESTRIPAQ